MKKLNDKTKLGDKIKRDNYNLRYDMESWKFEPVAVTPEFMLFVKTKIIPLLKLKNNLAVLLILFLIPSQKGRLELTGLLENCNLFWIFSMQSPETT